ncbi:MULTISPECIES: transglutaminase-like cysteine peptidase [Methylovorus]|jgi:predicted transglutaminase-like cysteine proteinase|uniref:transglutaminase-like cysteine peptidase n=1 Tax=Methylovorus TaxID=81682 RepID=UPI0001EC45B2|nr:MULTISPECIES: transglutaminase-like cysteine peptidase [Methylovorus]ADQ84226.1 transglutaminase family protein cysteine peptidase BTLCP [Methylovorus sp. MP688]KAF0844401.1 transglutaminase-like cysteine proteinase BTLCP [Methylovorus glucosotrophus]
MCLLLGVWIPGIQAATDFSKLRTLAEQRYGDRAKNTIIELEALLNTLRDAPDQEKLEKINLFVNDKIRRFDDDINIWGQSDYWATPLESLGREAGDCEDYSIAKYVFLRELGIPNEKLRLTYVRAKIGGPNSRISQAHMILSYYPTPNAEPLILDNLIISIRPASRRPDLVPIFSFNSEGLWTGTSTTPSSDSLSHLSRWRNVLARMQADGIE